MAGISTPLEKLSSVATLARSKIVSGASLRRGQACCVALVALGAGHAYANCVDSQPGEHERADLRAISNFSARVASSLGSAITTSNLAFLSRRLCLRRRRSPRGHRAWDKWGGCLGAGRRRGHQHEILRGNGITTPTEFPPPPQGNRPSDVTACNTQFSSSYGGVQVGADLAKFNLNGWDFHSGRHRRNSRIDQPPDQYSECFRKLRAGPISRNLFCRVSQWIFRGRAGSRRLLQRPISQSHPKCV